MATMTERKAEAQDAIETLHAKIATITDSDAWRAHLATMAKFHNYSPLNAMWMEAQWWMRQQEDPTLPAFSLPASFSAWKALGRSVRKGEKALSVLAPVLVNDDENVDENGKPRKKCVGFVLKRRTFDVSQTEGDPLPENPAYPSLLTGDADPATWAALVAHAEGEGFSVRVEAIQGAANGWCNHGTKTIAVEAANEPAQRTKTLIHEVAHLHLHGADTPEGMSRAEKEVEAESVAYVVASLLGFDTSDYSVGYVATWAGRDDHGECLRRTTERVVKCARKIAEAVATESAALAA